MAMLADNNGSSRSVASQRRPASAATALTPAHSTSRQIARSQMIRSPQLRQALHNSADIVGDGAKGVAGYRAAMYGEVGIGNRTARVTGEMRFGAINRDTSLAQRSVTLRSANFNNFGIDDFLRPGSRGYFARSSMASSQATWNFGRQVSALEGLRPSQIQFEAKRPDGRVNDVARPGANPGTQLETEIKAGKSIKSNQIRLDERFASPANKMEYVFADNPATGTKGGPSPAAETRLTTANRRSNGHLTHSYKPEISMKPGTMNAVKTSSVASKALRGAGKVAVPVGLVIDTVMIGSAVKADGGKFGANTKVAVAESAGGWAGAAGGAFGGAKAGAVIGTFVGGPAGAAIGGVVGGIVGGIAGAIGGSSLGGVLGKLW